MNDDNKDPVNNGEQGADVSTEKTYTKQDIDNSFNAGVKKASSEWQKDPNFKEFLEWKKSSQNDADKIAELQSNNDNLTKQNGMLNALLEVANSDCKKEFSKFVANEVNNMVTDTVNFETALKNYKKDNPQYFGEVQIKKTQSSPNLAGGTPPQTTSQIMNNLLRGN